MGNRKRKGIALMRAGVWMLAVWCVLSGGQWLSQWSWRHDLAGQARPTLNRYLTASRRDWMSGHGVEVINYMRGPLGAFINPILFNGGEFMVPIKPLRGLRHLIIRCPQRQTQCEIFERRITGAKPVSAKAVAGLLSRTFTLLRGADSQGDFPANRGRG